MSKPGNWIVWIPAFLYLFAALLDYIDGIVARLTNSTTILGEKLDMEMDGMGVLIATIVAIQYGQIPLIYIFVGLARYLFLAGIFIRNKYGLIINPLSASPFRRGLAGAQMGFLVTVLFPVFKPPVTQIAALFFMTPFLISFFIDWLTVSDANIPILQNLSLEKNIPIFLRILLLIWIFINFSTVVTVSSFNQILLLIMILFSLFGVASRISSFAIMLWCGFYLRQQPDNIWVWSLLIISMLIFFTGSGKYSLWKPEDYLLFRRVGE
jgi:CDP-diacylglycerol--glycerol-3-phosphate 3-phosphatidyltransferase